MYCAMEKYIPYEYFYALEKFNRAIHILATEEGDLRERLLCLFQGDLAMIDLKHLPKELHDDYTWILKTITKHDEIYKGQKEHFETDDGRYDRCLPGRIKASLHRMRNSTGKKIAKKLFNIYDVLNQKYYER